MFANSLKPGETANYSASHQTPDYFPLWSCTLCSDGKSCAVSKRVIPTYKTDPDNFEITRVYRILFFQKLRVPTATYRRSRTRLATTIPAKERHLSERSWRFSATTEAPWCRCAQLPARGLPPPAHPVQSKPFCDTIFYMFEYRLLLNAEQNSDTKSQNQDHLYHDCVALYKHF